MKHVSTPALVALLLLPILGCAPINYYTQTDKPVITGDLPERFEFKQHVSESKRNIYLVWGLVPFRVVEQNETSSAFEVPTKTYDDVPIVPGIKTGCPTFL